jgi:tRNA (mo5U34)-methyltransferase
VYDLARTNERWDLVLFMGVLYHLRHPLLALDLVASHAKRLVVFQTLTMEGDEVLEPGADTEIRSTDLLDPGWPKMAFVEKRLAGDPTNWWVPTHACVEAMARSCGLDVVGRPGHELYLCEPRGVPKSVRDELRAVTG